MIPKEADLGNLYNEKLNEIDRIITEGGALDLLPGKQILRQFLAIHANGLTDEHYLDTAVSTALAQNILIPEIERLKEILRHAPFGQGINTVEK